MFGYKAYLLIALTVMAFVLMACGTLPQQRRLYRRLSRLKG